MVYEIGLFVPHYLMKYFVIFLIGIISLSIPLYPQSSACSCIIESSDEALENSVAVFSGKVTKITEDQPTWPIISSAESVIIEFQVDRVLKGPSEKTIKVTTASDEGTCGYGFEMGKTYLVYSYEIEDNDPLVLKVSLCSKTSPIADASEDLSELEIGKIPNEVEKIIPPPLKQMKLGIKLGHIICDEDKIPTWNVHNKPACVYPESENKLLTRGWAKLRLMLPASGDPIKELEWTGKNELSMRFVGTYSIGDEQPLSYDQKRKIAWEYVQEYHQGKRLLEYSIYPHQYYYYQGEKIQFDLLEWGNYSECWNLNLRIFDNHNQVLHEETLNDVCLEPDGTPGTFNSYSIGKDSELVCKKPGYYLIEVSNGEIFPPTILQNFACLDTEPEPTPEPERTSEDEMNLRDAKQKLREIYSLNSSFGPFNIKDVIVGYGIADRVLVVDVLTEYYESDHLDLIKQKIRDIVGHKVAIEFSPSGAIVPTNIESVFPYVWNGFLHRNGIEFTPKEQSYGNHDIGFRDINRVCSPIVASNGTEFYISSIFIHEPFEITGTFIDKIKPDDCYKIWKTDTILEEPDRILMLWLENYHSSD